MKGNVVKFLVKYRSTEKTFSFQTDELFWFLDRMKNEFRFTIHTNSTDNKDFIFDVNENDFKEHDYVLYVWDGYD